MAITGSWKNQRVHTQGYSGAMRWGTGVNPIHSMRDPGHKPDISREPLRKPQEDNFVPEYIIGAQQWGYSQEDMIPGEDYQYLHQDYYGWGHSIQGRPDRDGEIFEPGVYPQPEGFPSWGPHNDDNPVDGFPLSGPSGGDKVRSYSTGGDTEAKHAVAVPTPGVSGGWLNKARSFQLEAQVSAPSQYEMNTSMTQVHQSSTNTRAVARGTDDLRTAIAARTAGMKEKSYGKSFAMGGGSGTPDMRPYQQSIIYRPFYFRSPGLPPKEQHFMNTMESRQPMQRSVPPDPYQGNYAGSGNDYGYSSEDYYG